MLILDYFLRLNLLLDHQFFHSILKSLYACDFSTLINLPLVKKCSLLIAIHIKCCPVISIKPIAGIVNRF